MTEVKYKCKTFAHSRRNADPCKSVLCILHWNEKSWHLIYFLLAAYHHCPGLDCNRAILLYFCFSK